MLSLWNDIASKKAFETPPYHTLMDLLNACFFQNANNPIEYISEVWHWPSSRIAVKGCFQSYMHVSAVTADQKQWSIEVSFLRKHPVVSYAYLDAQSLLSNTEALNNASYLWVGIPNFSTNNTDFLETVVMDKADRQIALCLLNPFHHAPDFNKFPQSLREWTEFLKCLETQQYYDSKNPYVQKAIVQLDDSKWEEEELALFQKEEHRQKDAWNTAIDNYYLNGILEDKHVLPQQADFAISMTYTLKQLGYYPRYSKQQDEIELLDLASQIENMGLPLFNHWAKLVSSSFPSLTIMPEKVSGLEETIIRVIQKSLAELYQSDLYYLPSMDMGKIIKYTQQLIAQMLQEIWFYQCVWKQQPALQQLLLLVAIEEELASSPHIATSLGNRLIELIKNIQVSSEVDIERILPEGVTATASIDYRDVLASMKEQCQAQVLSKKPPTISINIEAFIESGLLWKLIKQNDPNGFYL